MVNRYVLIFFAFIATSAGEECVTYDFEDNFNDVFDFGSICQSTGAARWSQIFYENSAATSPHELSTRAITPSSRASCTVSFPFTMQGGGLLQVNVFMRPILASDNVNFMVYRKEPNGADSAVGGASSNRFENRFGENTLNFTIPESMHTFEGYFVLSGTSGFTSTVLVDSFRYVPSTVDASTCVIYKDDDSGVSTTEGISTTESDETSTIVPDDGTCVTYDFEDNFNDVFDFGSICQLTGAARWSQIFYENSAATSPHELSTRAITPSSRASCTVSFPFTMQGGGLLQVNVFMRPILASDNVNFMVYRKEPNGADSAVGGASSNRFENRFGENTLNFTIPESMDTFEGYFVLSGTSGFTSTVLVDSFRYVPSSMDANTCVIYKEDDDSGTSTTEGTTTTTTEDTTTTTEDATTTTEDTTTTTEDTTTTTEDTTTTTEDTTTTTEDTTTTTEDTTTTTEDTTTTTEDTTTTTEDTTTTTEDTTTTTEDTTTTTEDTTTTTEDTITTTTEDTTTTTTTEDTTTTTEDTTTTTEDTTTTTEDTTTTTEDTTTTTEDTTTTTEVTTTTAEDTTTTTEVTTTTAEDTTTTTEGTTTTTEDTTTTIENTTTTTEDTTTTTEDTTTTTEDTTTTTEDTTTTTEDTTTTTEETTTTTEETTTTTEDTTTTTEDTTTTTEDTTTTTEVTTTTAEDTTTTTEDTTTTTEVTTTTVEYTTTTAEDTTTTTEDTTTTTEVTTTTTEDTTTTTEGTTTTEPDDITCVTYDFEDNFNDVFYFGSICQLSGADRWSVISYENTVAINPHELSTRAITPSSWMSCTTSFTFTMQGGGLLQVNMFMQPLLVSDNINIMVYRKQANGEDSVVGGVTSNRLDNRFGPNILNYTIPASMGTFEGYFLLMGMAGISSTVLVDSFRYVPVDMDESTCIIYDNEEPEESENQSNENVEGGKCTTLQFQPSEFKSFGKQGMICNMLSNWILGNELPDDLDKFNEDSESFISPSTSLSCISSFDFDMTSNGVVEVNLLTRAENDYVVVSVFRTGDNGAHTLLAEEMETYTASTWTTLNIPLPNIDDSTVFKGHITIMGTAATENSVFIDSFRFYSSEQKDDCIIYPSDAFFKFRQQ